MQTISSFSFPLLLNDRRLHYGTLFYQPRDMILRMDGPKHSLRFPLRNFQVHKRFMKEGKATICLKDQNVNLMLANAPPNQLLIFMKTLVTKQVDGSKNSTVISARQRLLSTAPKCFEEISPLTFKVQYWLWSSGGVPLPFWLSSLFIEDLT